MRIVHCGELCGTRGWIFFGNACRGGCIEPTLGVAAHNQRSPRGELGWLTAVADPYRTKQELRRSRIVYRLARESLALASVASFVWMVCQLAQFAG
jgi:hypothetical protein